MIRAKKRQILVDHYLDFYSVAIAMLKDEADAQDAVQEALVRTLVKHGVKDVHNYCMRTVKNLCVDTLRRKNRMHKVDEMMIVSNTEYDELLKAVERGKSVLSEEGRALLELHYEEGYTLAEVSAIMQIPLSSMKRMLAQAKNELRKILEDEL